MDEPDERRDGRPAAGGAGREAGAGSADGPALRRSTRLRLADVAALAGTSPATASLALNGKAVSATTRARVLAAARQLRYVPAASARALKTGRTATIGVVVVNRPQTRELTGSSPFYYAVLRGSLDAGEEHGFHISWHVITMDLDSDDPQLGALAASGRYDALVVFPQWANDGRYARSTVGLGVPTVIVNNRAGASTWGADGRTAAARRRAPTAGERYGDDLTTEELAAATATVSMDNEHAIRLALEHLVGLGHERIAYLAGPAEHLEADRRLAAYRTAMAAWGMDVPTPYVYRVEYTIEDGAAGFDALWDRIAGGGAPVPTAVLAASDYVAAGLMQAAHRRGIAVPDQLSVVGFDDLDVAQATNPRLTTVAQPLNRLGRTVTDAAISLIRGERVGPVTLRTSLVERESVAPAATGQIPPRPLPGPSTGATTLRSGRRSPSHQPSRPSPRRSTSQRRTA